MRPGGRGERWGRSEEKRGRSGGDHRLPSLRGMVFAEVLPLVGAGAGLSHQAALEHLQGFLREQLGADRVVGVGHRVVHGGPEYAEPVRVDAHVLEALERLIPLAPLHQPHNLAPIAALLAREPGLPQVACFDTAFHRTNPDVAQRWAHGRRDVRGRIFQRHPKLRRQGRRALSVVI